MTFKPHDRTKPYRHRTPAQDDALRVMRIRGLFYHSYTLSGWRAKVMRLLCDAELIARGQETQTARDARKRAEFEAQLAADDAIREIDFAEVPF